MSSNFHTAYSDTNTPQLDKNSPFSQMYTNCTPLVLYILYTLQVKYEQVKSWITAKASKRMRHIYIEDKLSDWSGNKIKSNQPTHISQEVANLQRTWKNIVLNAFHNIISFKDGGWPNQKEAQTTFEMYAK